MNKVKNESYLNIQGWMINELQLKGNELLVYAIIYGFSQDDGSLFSGSRQYLADWCNSTVRSIQNVLNSLVDKKLLTKYEEVHNGVKYCSYVANFMSSEKSSRGSEKSSLNNIVNNIDDTLSKDNVYNEPQQEFKFGVIDEKPKKKNLYQKCLDLIYSYTDEFNLQSSLIKYLDFVLEKYRNEGKQLYENQWKGLLKKLDNIDDKVASVEQSLSKGYVGFYPVNSYSKPTNRDTNSSPQKKFNPNDLAYSDDGSLKTY